jgi:hypothetical protein
MNRRTPALKSPAVTDHPLSLLESDGFMEDVTAAVLTESIRGHFLVFVSAPGGEGAADADQASVRAHVDPFEEGDRGRLTVVDVVAAQRCFGKALKPPPAIEGDEDHVIVPGLAPHSMKPNIR